MTLIPYLTDDESEGRAYRPDSMGRLGQGRLMPLRRSDPLGRLAPDQGFDSFRQAWRRGATLEDLFGGKPFALTGGVGPNAENRRADVAKVQTFLGRTGHLDLASTDGPTGHYSWLLDDAIKGFQRDNGLAVDGTVTPRGETSKALAEKLRQKERPGTAAGPVRTQSANPSSRASATESTERAQTPRSATAASGYGKHPQKGPAGRAVADVGKTIGTAHLPMWPASAATQDRLDQMSQSTGFTFRKTEHGIAVVEPSTGRTLVQMDEDRAAELIDQWPAFAQRMKMMSLLGRPDLTSEQKIAIAARMLPPVDKKMYQNPDLRGVNLARQGATHRYKTQQTLVDNAKKAFDAAAQALEQGANPRVAQHHLQQALFPELYNGRLAREIMLDLIPVVGNVRSVKHVGNDLARRGDAAQDGNKSGVAENLGMVLLDGLGAIPGGNIGKALGRGIVKATPGGEAVRAAAKLGMMGRRYAKAKHAVEPERLLGEELKNLPTHVQDSVSRQIRWAHGSAGERHVLDLVKKIDPDAVAPTHYVKPNGSFPRENARRMYDVEGRSLKQVLYDGVMERYAKWRGAAPHQRGPGIQFEAKTGDAQKTRNQIEIDQHFRSHPDEARAQGIGGIRDVRVKPGEIPMAYVIDDATIRFDRLVKGGVIDRKTADVLLNAMEKQLQAGVNAVKASDYATVLARLAASSIRAAEAGSAE